jgi:hypothetical protein
MPKRVRVKSKRRQKRKTSMGFHSHSDYGEAEELDLSTIPFDFYYLLALGKPKLRYLLLSVDAICMIIIAAVSIPFILFRIPDLSHIPQTVLTIMGSFFMACALTRFLMFTRLYINREKARLDPRYVLAVRFANFYCNIISATLFTVICFYYFGVIDFIAYMLHTYWPKFSEKLSYGISTALSWIMSAVVGGAAYDLIKKMFKKNEAESDKNLSASEKNAAPDRRLKPTVRY